MASPAPEVQDQPTLVGEKRKRETEDIDSNDEYHQDESNSTVKPDSVVPDNYSLSHSDGEEQTDVEDDDENVVEEASDIPTHDDSAEPFPKCAIFDDDIEAIEEKITALSQQLLDKREEHGCGSLKPYISRAQKLCNLPETPKMRIAILGSAGVGKSSLLNAITGKADLAKSLSGGQSCTCVPTEYQDAFPGQTLDFAASFQYLQPEAVKRQLHEMIKQYNTFAFEADRDWNEDDRTSARNAHANALKLLRTLFNDQPSFKSKVATVEYMKAMYTQQDLLLDELATSCELKLKHTVRENYKTYQEAKTLAKLRSRIDPLMNSIGTFDEPSLWPLLRHVSIGVRGSRVLEHVTLVDLPGISDTNQSRVELTHEFIRSCNYIWIVVSIIRAMDDGTLFQLLSRYGQVSSKGMVSVICTRSDDDIIASETKLVNDSKDADEDVEPYVALSDRMKAQKSAITALKGQVAKIKSKKKRATKQQMMDARELEEHVKGLTRKYARLEAERFAFFVQTQNAMVTKRMQDELQSYLHPGHVLEVHCVSNSHYAALNRAGIRGPRLTAETTGIPRLRANTIALVAPQLLTTLEKYVTFQVKSLLDDLNVFLQMASTDRRVEILALASQPRDKLPSMVVARISSLAIHIQTIAEGTFQQAMPEASRAALEQLAKKGEKHWKTISAFIRNDGNHQTKLCPKESWNENFMKSLKDVIIGNLNSFGGTRAQLTEDLESGVIENLNRFRKDIEDFPADLPKHQLVLSIETSIQGIRYAFAADRVSYEDDSIKLNVDSRQDCGRNPFTRAMRPVYQKCAEDKGVGVTKRSIGRIHDVLSDTGSGSPLARLSYGTSKRLASNDKKHIGETLEKSVSCILDQVHETVNGALSEKVEDEAELVARADLQQFLPALLATREQVDKYLQAVTARYG